MTTKIFVLFLVFCSFAQGGAFAGENFRDSIAQMKIETVEFKNISLLQFASYVKRNSKKWDPNGLGIEIVFQRSGLEALSSERLKRKDISVVASDLNLLLLLELVKSETMVSFREVGGRIEISNRITY